MSLVIRLNVVPPHTLLIQVSEYTACSVSVKSPLQIGSSFVGTSLAHPRSSVQ